MISSIATTGLHVYNKLGPPPPIPPVTYSLIDPNVQFPSAYIGMEYEMSQITTYNRRITYTPSTSSSYRNQPHEFLCSSYQNYNNTQNGLIQDMFDNASSASTFWANNTPPSQINYLDGVAQPHPTQNPYNISGVYVGAGADQFYTTIHNSGSSDGEWFQIKFPYSVGLMELGFIARAANVVGGARDVDILGSRDGVNWTFLKNQTYPAYTNLALNTATFTLLPHYEYIRVVIKSVTSNGIGLASCKMKFHVYQQDP